jgi:hypothetical protein
VITVHAALSLPHHILTTASSFHVLRFIKLIPTLGLFASCFLCLDSGPSYFLNLGSAFTFSKWDFLIPQPIQNYSSLGSQSVVLGHVEISFKGSKKVKTSFMTKVRYNFLFFLPFCHKYTVEFSRNYMAGDIETEWVKKQWEFYCLLLNQTFKRFRKIFLLFSLITCFEISEFIKFFTYIMNNIYGYTNNKHLKIFSILISSMVKMIKIQ